VRRCRRADDFACSPLIGPPQKPQNRGPVRDIAGSRASFFFQRAPRNLPDDPRILGCIGRRSVGIAHWSSGGLASRQPSGDHFLRNLRFRWPASTGLDSFSLHLGTILDPSIEPARRSSQRFWQVPTRRLSSMVFDGSNLLTPAIRPPNRRRTSQRSARSKACFF